MSNIFDSDCDALVNPVNCVGVMGAGLAKQFKERFPDMYKAYEGRCRFNVVKIGQMDIHPQSVRRSENGIIIDGWIINFPTKQHWREPSRLVYIVNGLASLRRCIPEWWIRSIAIPPLGCGLGGLSWNDVQPLIHEALGDLGVRVDVYPPSGNMYVLSNGA